MTDGFSKMRDYISDFPQHLKDGYSVGLAFNLEVIDINSIIICGMGGSAIGGDLLKGLAVPETHLLIYVNRNYNLPGWVNERSLVILSSYSGNTAETLSCFKAAKIRNAQLMAVTSGGELARICDKYGVPRITIPGGMPPRAALGYSFSTLLAVFKKLGIFNLTDEEINSAFIGLKNNSDSFKSNDSPPARLASIINDKIPVFYTDGYQLEAVGTRFRGQIAENAKSMAFSNVFPELNHNEIVGWGIPTWTSEKLCAVFLEDSDSSPEVDLQMQSMKSILIDNNIQTHTIKSQGDSFLERMLYLVHFGDWLSWHLARITGVDPIPVERIDLLKKKLSHNKK